MTDTSATGPVKGGFIASLKQYIEPAPLAALMLGISSGFPYAMIAATLTTRLKQDGITKSTITAFTLAFLVHNFKWVWAWVVDAVRLPVIGKLGQRVSWLIVTGLFVMAAVANLAFAQPKIDIWWTVYAAILVGVAGATFDVVIDAYRIELLDANQLGVGSGMSQYGWRIGSAGAGAIALYVSARHGWTAGYLACAILALPAMVTGLVMGEPARRVVTIAKRSARDVWAGIYGPFTEFLQRRGAIVVLAFLLVHKIGDTLANLTFRLLFDDLKFTNDEIAFYDVLIGFWAYLIGIFIGGILYSKMGLKNSVLLALFLMAISNLSFAGLAVLGHDNWAMAAAIGFENIASGFGGVVLVAYFSALCDLRFTAAQYALISAATSVVGRFITGTTAGATIESFGYVNFYLLTTVLAVPGILIYLWMMRTGLVDEALGSVAKTAD
jgi:MFS transporter, PAT family, beta-lactamase induction signal transducer AmpG